MDDFTHADFLGLNDLFSVEEVEFSFEANRIDSLSGESFLDF